MIYAFKCRSCGERFDRMTREVAFDCPACGSIEVRRDYSTVQLGVSAFKPHFNHAVGAYVDSSRKFDDLLKIRGEEAGSTFSRIDPGEAPTPSTDTQIFETQAKTIRDRGLNPSDLT